MKSHIHIIFLLFCLVYSCKKEKKNPVTETEVLTILEDTSIFACKNLPPAPIPFGWRDSTTDNDKNINTFMYNPVNPDEIIYVVQGDLFGYNKMFTYNIPTKKTTYLASISNFPPQVNKYGWILFSTDDYEVYRIKTNGDSLIKLTAGNRSKDPKWDYTDLGIYIYQMAYSNNPSTLAKVNFNGYPLLNFPLEMAYTAAFKKSNQIVYLKSRENLLSLVQREITPPNTEKILLTVSFSPTSSAVYFDNLTLDNNDENVYWSNSSGIIKCNLVSLKVDTVLKNCENIKYDNPIFQSSKPNSMLVDCHIIKSLNTFQLLHTYKAVEYDLTTKEKTEIKIFP